MTAELIAGLVALLLALVGGGVGWQQVRKHGERKAENRRLREERDAAIQGQHDAAAPPLDGDEQLGVLRRLPDRRDG